MPPVLTNNPLNVGRVAWWYGLSPIANGPIWYDLLNRAPGTVSGVAWSPTPYGSSGITGAGNTGTTQGVVVADPSGHLAGLATLSVGLWARATSSGGSGAGRAITQNDTAGYAVAINGSSGCQFIVGGTTLGISSVGNLADSVWRYYMMTFDGATIRGYINGAFMGSFGRTGAVPASTAGVVIGNRQSSSGGARAWGGQIADVSIWGRALSPDQAFGAYVAALHGHPAEIGPDSPFVIPLAVSPPPPTGSGSPKKFSINQRFGVGVNLR